MIFSTPIGTEELVISGLDCINTYKDELARLGSRALIVTGKSSAAKNGSLDDVCKALESVYITYEIFNEIEENPSVETVMKAARVGEYQKVDMVIGIGGGSPLDAAKAISIMIANADKTKDFLYQKVEDLKYLPVVAVPTTCGTGSEVTGVAVLTVHDKKTKASLPHRLFPDIAFIDPKYLRTAPYSVIKNTAVDAFGHMVESYINASATEESKEYVNKGLSIWSEVKDKLRNEAELDDDDRMKLMMAAMYGGISIAFTGTTIPHGLSYRTTYELGVPHGKAIGYFLYGYMKEANAEDTNHVLEISGFKDLSDFHAFFGEVCGWDKLDKEVLDKSINDLANNPAKLKASGFEMNRETLERIAYTTL